MQSFARPSIYWTPFIKLFGFIKWHYRKEDVNPFFSKVDKENTIIEKSTFHIVFNYLNLATSCKQFFKYLHIYFNVLEIM